MSIKNKKLYANTSLFDTGLTKGPQRGRLSSSSPCPLPNTAAAIYRPAVAHFQGPAAGFHDKIKIIIIDILFMIK